MAGERRHDLRRSRGGHQLEEPEQPRGGARDRGIARDRADGGRGRRDRVGEADGHPGDEERERMPDVRDGEPRHRKASGEGDHRPRAHHALAADAPVIRAASRKPLNEATAGKKSSRPKREGETPSTSIAT